MAVSRKEIQLRRMADHLQTAASQPVNLCRSIRDNRHKVDSRLEEIRQTVVTEMVANAVNAAASPIKAISLRAAIRRMVANRPEVINQTVASPTAGSSRKAVREIANRIARQFQRLNSFAFTTVVPLSFARAAILTSQQFARRMWSSIALTTAAASYPFAPAGSPSSASATIADSCNVPAARVGFVQRTYVVRGRPYVRVYRSYNYRGIAYVRYVPAYYYSPRFYIWAYNPWVRPVYFGWGWGRRAPWFYGGYFAPAPFYVSASLWLTDYIIAENLRASYEAQLDAQGQQYAPPPPDNTAADPNDYNNAELSPALRQAIADEVSRQLNAEKAPTANPQAAGDNSSSDQAPPALAADQRVFVVSAPLQVYDGDQPCSLTAGDVISRIEDSPGNDDAVASACSAANNPIAAPARNPAFRWTICRTCPTTCERKPTKV